MSIIDEIETYLLNVEIGKVVKINDMVNDLSKMYNRAKHCYVLTDHCYNRTNLGIKFNTIPKYFLYLKKGVIQYVGKDYIYSGPVYHKNKMLNIEQIVAYCKDGIYTLIN